MTNTKFSLRALLLAVAIVALYFPFERFYAPWRLARLQRTHHIFADFETLSRLSNGDSVQEVKSHYPLLEMVSAESDRWPKLSRHFESGGLKVEGADQFGVYKVHGDGNFGYLHFRANKLISHDPEVFSDPTANTLRNGAALPSFFERIGSLPLYLGVIALTLGLYRALRTPFLESSVRGSRSPKLEQPQT